MTTIAINLTITNRSKVKFNLQITSKKMVNGNQY